MLVYSTRKPKFFKKKLPNPLTISTNQTVYILQIQVLLLILVKSTRNATLNS